MIISVPGTVQPAVFFDPACCIELFLVLRPELAKRMDQSDRSL